MSMSVEKFEMIFNQDYSSICAFNDKSVRFFGINKPEQADEIYALQNPQQLLIAQRLYRTSFAVLVMKQRPKMLRIIDYKKNQAICKMDCESEILLVRMNRKFLVIFTAEKILVRHIRTMAHCYELQNCGSSVCALSAQSVLAFASTEQSGDVRLFDIKARAYQTTGVIQAHNSPLKAMDFAPNCAFLATASERGTVIRVFCAKTGARLQEFRRGARPALISSLVFSTCSNYLCLASDHQTVHVFRIDQQHTEKALADKQHLKEQQQAQKAAAKAAEQQQQQPDCEKRRKQRAHKNEVICGGTPWLQAAHNAAPETNGNEPIAASAIATPSDSSSGNDSDATASWGEYLSSTVKSMVPATLSDEWWRVRAYAYVTWPEAERKLCCALTKLGDEHYLLIACDDGFLYVYDFNADEGGVCQRLYTHDLRDPKHGIEEVGSLAGMQNGYEQDVQASTTTTLTIDANEADFEVYKSCLDETAAAAVAGNNSEPATISTCSYANMVKGKQQMPAMATMTDSAKLRERLDHKLVLQNSDEILFDECEFPTVECAAKN